MIDEFRYQAEVDVIPERCPILKAVTDINVQTFLCGFIMTQENKIAALERRIVELEGGTIEERNAKALESLGAVMGAIKKL